jgi:hypothetical protein
MLGWKPRESMNMQQCDPVKVQAFDYSGLSAAFQKLAKPAKRALINNGITTTEDMAKHTEKEVMKFHGIGRSALPLLRAALQADGLEFLK